MVSGTGFGVKWLNLEHESELLWVSLTAVNSKNSTTQRWNCCFLEVSFTQIKTWTPWPSSLESETLSCWPFLVENPYKITTKWLTLFPPSILPTKEWNWAAIMNVKRENAVKSSDKVRRQAGTQDTFPFPPRSYYMDLQSEEKTHK